MGTRAFTVLVAVVFGAVIGACKSDLLPGRCDKDSDCPSGKCNLEKNGRCEPQDGGTDFDADAGGADVGDAGDAAEVWSCEGLMCVGSEPVCDKTMMKCRACGANMECAELGKSVPVCAMSGKCVECTMNNHCEPTSTKPVCDTAMNSCTGCKVGGTECAMIDKAKPACAATGACVECVTNADCKGDSKPVPKPICDKTSNTCQPCKADAECTEGPKVCMSHQDGRCASDDETIYVQKIASCPGSAAAADGSATKPYCTMDPAVAAITPSRRLLVLKGIVPGTSAGISAGASQVSIVGQANAAIAPSDVGFHLLTGDAYVRSVAIGPSLLLGCQADTGSTIRLDRVVITGNKGGVYLNGAAFDIQNTTVTNNEYVDDGAIWAGIYAKNPPAAGPAKLKFVTVQNNKATGIVCSGPIEGDGVLSSGNTTSNINTTCKVTNCDTASATCGAQP